jgi:PqqD family protein of HPr-rel-A system
VGENHRLKLAKYVVVREVGDEVVAYARDSGEVHQLNATAGYILDRCDGRTPVSAIITSVIDRFDVDRTTAERDVGSAVREMEALGLVVAADVQETTE